MKLPPMAMATHLPRIWQKTEIEVDFKEAVRAICEVIDFACALPW